MDSTILSDRVNTIQKKNNLPKVIFGMEPSGSYWFHTYEFLELRGKRAVTVSPLAVRRNRETINVSKDKTDPKDAHNITDLVGQGKFYLPVYRNKEIRQLKRLMQLYYRLIRQRASLRCRLRGVVGYIFPELEHYFGDITAKSIILILEKATFPEKIRKMGKSRFTSFLARKNPYLGQRRAEEIFKLARNSVGIAGEEEATSLEIRLLLEELKNIKKNVAIINVKVQAIVKTREDYQLLLTIQGVGPITAASLIAEIGDATNFSSGKQLIKLAGLDLYGLESGISIHSQRKISKRGRKTLRTVVYQAAVGCVRCNAHLKACYLEFLSHQTGKKKIKPKALVAIASKLLRIVYRMLTNKEGFDASYDEMLRERFALRTLKAA